ncbi:MAG: sulfotransferase domain-containing protein [Solirubrobacterales bacterium]
MRRSTARWRVLPDFIVIGVHKGGTTSVYEYLAQHPQVVPAFEKELQYFTSFFDNDERSYRAKFPNVARMGAVRRRAGRAATGEASPSYISNPRAPARVRAMVPEARLVLLLRNPVDRAVSAFHHNKKKTPWEDLATFSEAVDRELGELSDELELVLADDSRSLEEYLHHCYLRRGVYLEQIKWWHAHFPPEQLLILQYERLSTSPEALLLEIEQHLGLEPWVPDELERFNTNTYPDLEDDLRRKLVEYFAPHNEELFEYLGERFDWS